MPRTREQLQKALADTEAWLDSLDPQALASPDSDGSDLYAIGEGLRAVAVNDLIFGRSSREDPGKWSNLDADRSRARCDQAGRARAFWRGRPSLNGSAKAGHGCTDTGSTRDDGKCRRTGQNNAAMYITTGSHLHLPRTRALGFARLLQTRIPRGQKLRQIW